MANKNYPVEYNGKEIGYVYYAPTVDKWGGYCFWSDGWIANVSTEERAIEYVIKDYNKVITKTKEQIEKLQKFLEEIS